MSKKKARDKWKARIRATKKKESDSQESGNRSNA